MVARTLLMILCFCTLLPGADQWVKVTTPHFELYTTAGEKKGREAILYFEQVRNFFMQVSASKTAPDAPVRIVAFKNEKQYLPYRGRETAFAYFNSTEQRDYIVMQDISSDHYPVAIHEYMHLLVRHTGVKLPVWLNEGMAEVFSTMKPMGKKVLVGELPMGRVQTLNSQKWLDLGSLTGATHDSPLYNEKNKASMFYAQSWLLTHMMLLGPEYRPGYSKFLASVGSGKSGEEAWQEVYGKPLAVVQKDLLAYSRADRLMGALFDEKLEKSAEDPSVVDVPSTESELMLADLLIVANKPAEAEAEFKRLAKEHPQNADVEESLGYLAWQGRRMDEARSHFAKSISLGSKNAKMCYQYALMERGAGGDGKEVVEALQKAISLKPDYRDAVMALGMEALRTQKYGLAMDSLNRIKSVKPDEAYGYFSALSFAYMKLGGKPQAKTHAESARKYAKTPAEIERADQMLRYLNDERPAAAAATAPSAADLTDEDAAPVRLRRREEAPFDPKARDTAHNPFVPKGETLQSVKGTAHKLECLGQSAKFYVTAGGKVIGFAIPDPSKVLLKNAESTSFEFTCGPQKPFAVTVEYAARPDDQSGTAGILRSLEF